MIKIANAVYTTEVVELQDGTEVTLKPLPIARLRRFMKAWKKMAVLIQKMQEEMQKNAEEGKAPDENDDETLDVFISCCGIALEKELSSKISVTTKSNKELSNEYRSYLEDVLDMDTIYKIMEVCGGMKLNQTDDPKALLDQVNLPGTI